MGSRLSNSATAVGPLGSMPDIPQQESQRVVSCANNGDMSVLETGCGKPCKFVDACQLGDDVFSSPVAVGLYILCGCRDDHLWCLQML